MNLGRRMLTHQVCLCIKQDGWKNAEQYFEQEIVVNHTDAFAYYMLGNIFLKLKRLDKAEKEYQKAISLNSDGWIVRYSQLALHYLEGTNIEKPTLSSYIDSSNQQQLKTSVKSISRETDDKEQAEQVECKAKVEQIYREADQKTEILQDELQALLALDTRRVAALYNAALREDYYSQIEKIKSQARDEADRITAAYKEKAKLLEDSALSLYQTYTNKDDSNISLISIASNIYVRNYQTTDSAYGETLAILASPQKLSTHNTADYRASSSK